MAHNKPEGQRFILGLNHLVLCKPAAVFESQLCDGQEAGKKDLTVGVM